MLRKRVYPPATLKKLYPAPYMTSYAMTSSGDPMVSFQIFPFKDCEEYQLEELFPLVTKEVKKETDLNTVSDLKRWISSVAFKRLEKDLNFSYFTDGIVYNWTEYKLQIILGACEKTYPASSHDAIFYLVVYNGSLVSTLIDKSFSLGFRETSAYKDRMNFYIENGCHAGSIVVISLNQ